MAEQVVTNSAELAIAVADMNIDVIRFGANIELESGITIPANKTSLLFDGMYEGVRYRFTDYNSFWPNDTIQLSGASSIALTFQNMDITGRNYYGIPYISASGTSGVTLTYRDITYVGPQLVFNPYGLTRFENVDITIIQSTSPADEVGEVRGVEFFGNNIIQHNSTEDAVFWFHSNPAFFRLYPNATLTVNTLHYFMYNTDISSLIAYPVEYEIQQGASFALTSAHGISRGTNHLASSFLVGTNASFRYMQTGVNSYDASLSSLYLTGSFTVNQGASVYMQANFENARPLLSFPSGTGASLVLNNPKSFVVYNRVNVPIAVTAPTRSYSINTEQLNRWTGAQALPGAGGFDDIPQNYWHNADWASFTVTGNITSTTTTATATELVNPQFPLTNFTYQNARVISAGDILIEPDTVIDNGRPITGLTEPNANLRISFSVDGTLHSFTLTAGGDGRFEVDPEMPIPVGTIISISANTPFLIKTIESAVAPTGDVTIERAPVRIEFKTPPVSTNPVLLRRPDPEEPVEVYDSRPYPTRWELLASITGPLKAANGEVLENAVVFKDNDEMLWELSSVPILVYMGGPRTGSTDVFWTEDKGILFRATQPIRSGVEYSTQLIWTLNVIEEG